MDALLLPVENISLLEPSKEIVFDQIKIATLGPSGTNSEYAAVTGEVKDTDI